MKFTSLETLAGSADKHSANGSKKEIKMSDEKVKTGFWIDKELMDEIDELLPKSNSDSRNEFIKKAIKFYIGFLRTKRTETYLLSTFNSAIHGTIGGAEQRMSRVLYKLAVEVAMQNRIIAYDKHFAESAIEQIREISEKEVREIIGYWGK